MIPLTADELAKEIRKHHKFWPTMTDEAQARVIIDFLQSRASGAQGADGESARLVSLWDSEAAKLELAGINQPNYDKGLASGLRQCASNLRDSAARQARLATPQPPTRQTCAYCAVAIDGEPPKDAGAVPLPEVVAAVCDKGDGFHSMHIRFFPGDVKIGDRLHTRAQLREYGDAREAAAATIPKVLLDWLADRDLMPDVEDDGSIDWANIMTSLQVHEDGLLNPIAREAAGRVDAVPAAMSGKYSEVLRPFLAMMEHELHANAGKGDRPGWLTMSSETAMLEIYYHVAKLQKAVRNGDVPSIGEYSADVANMTMMVADIYCALITPDGDAPIPQHPPAEPETTVADNDIVQVERGLLGAAHAAIAKKRDAPRVLAALREITMTPRVEPASVNQPMTTQGEDLAVIIASELARIDGYDPEDQHSGLYELRWTGFPTPEPEGDAWNMDYLPKAERIAKAITGPQS